MALERLVRVFCILKKNMQEHTGSMQIVFPNTHICYTQFMNSPDLLNYGFLLKNIGGPPGRLLGLLGRQGPSLFSNHWNPSAYPSAWYWVGNPNKWRDLSDSLYGWYWILEDKVNLSLSLSLRNAKMTLFERISIFLNWTFVVIPFLSSSFLHILFWQTVTLIK